MTVTIDFGGRYRVFNQIFSRHRIAKSNGGCRGCSAWPQDLSKNTLMRYAPSEDSSRYEQASSSGSSWFQLTSVYKRMLDGSGVTIKGRGLPERPGIQLFTICK
ncbi:hypothetical protein CEXT_720391 [Caerostris extrusa]|uniref:Uncharacterized protein n=1 Tax=Caerostris extrusa TaxID=172846 RepID=A0AAV4NB77_CAEEX|nr:hypothetical protein CEXT_720391 [Caerostris extrusa]